MSENELDIIFFGDWGECFDILSPFQIRLDYDTDTMELNKNEN